MIDKSVVGSRFKKLGCNSVGMCSGIGVTKASGVGGNCRIERLGEYVRRNTKQLQKIINNLSAGGGRGIGIVSFGKIVACRHDDRF